jgi:hypothetical protein
LSDQAMRAVLLVLGIALLAASAVAALNGCPLGAVFRLGIPGLVLTGAILLERGRYNPNSPDRSGPDWIATDERFADHESGEIVTVFYQPKTGERRYVSGAWPRPEARSRWFR